MSTNPTETTNGVAACACAGHSRARFLRATVARAGTGLPAIEPGMPLPAGTGLSRRSFLARAAGLALSVYGANILSDGALTEGIDAAMAAPTDRVLVNVFLDGGADVMSILAPVGHPQYASLRPTLRQAAGIGTPFAEDTSMEWHPQATALAQLHAAGKLTVSPAIGYASPNQSHFTSRHFYEVGELDPEGRYGWLGRYLDRHGAADNPLQGLTLSSSLSPMLAASSVPVAAVSNPSSYRFSAPGVSDPIRTPMLGAMAGLGSAGGGDAGLSQARNALHATATLREQVSQFSTVSPPVTYRHFNPSGTPPTSNGFAQRMRALAEMLAPAAPRSPLPLHMVAIDASGGYDTHSDQAAGLASNFRVTFETLQDFQADLEARGAADRVLVSVWSEFGRRPQENGSGTDHGAAGVHLLMGTRASGQMIGEFPGLATLDSSENLRSTSDFRALYCALLAQWLEVDPAPIIPGTFTQPTILKP